MRQKFNGISIAMPGSGTHVDDIHTCGLPPPDRVNYPRTFEAMVDYMATKPVRDWMRDDISGPASRLAWELAEHEAEETLQYAFFFDTSDIHSREDCRRMSALEIYRVLYPRSVSGL